MNAFSVRPRCGQDIISQPEKRRLATSELWGPNLWILQFCEALDALDYLIQQDMVAHLAVMNGVSERRSFINLLKKGMTVWQICDGLLRQTDEVFLQRIATRDPDETVRHAALIQLQRLHQ